MTFIRCFITIFAVWDWALGMRQPDSNYFTSGVRLISKFNEDFLSRHKLSKGSTIDFMFNK